MPDAAQYLITISADGTGAVRALDGVNQAFAGLVETHNRIKSNFTEQFQHAGVYLFSRQLLGLAGLSDVARHAMSIINVGAAEVAETIGLTAGQFGVAAAAAGALILAYEKLSKSTKDHGEELDKHVKALSTDIESTGQLRDKLDGYSESVGGLTPRLEGLAKANNALYEAQRALLTIELKEKIEQLDTAIQKQQETSVKVTAGYAAEAAALDRYAQGSDGAIAANAALTEQLDKQDVELKKLEATKAMAMATLDSLAKGYTGVTDEIDKTTKAMDEEAEWLEKLNDATNRDIKIAEEYGDKMFQAQEKRIQAEENAETRSIKLQDERLSKMEHFFGVQANDEMQAEALAGRVSQSFANNFGNAFAKALVEGKSFTEEFQKAFQNMAEQIIADLVKMIIEQEIFNALIGAGMGGWGTVGTGMGNTSAFGPSANFFASGVDTVFDRPTPIMVGEGGEPERVQVTPLSQMGGGGGGGGGTTVNANITVNAYGVNDPRELAEQTAPHIIDIIRGRGNLSFTGPNIG